MNSISKFLCGHCPHICDRLEAKEKLTMATITRIDIRVDDGKKQVITTAAELAGQTLTQYVMGLVWPDAERRVAENHRVKLSAADWAEFMSRLDAPPKDLPALRVLLNRESRFSDA
jgi:uncharacterized protein (DUF1778 family)